MPDTNLNDRTTTPNELIQQARRRYLAAHPLRITDVPCVNMENGQPAGSMKIPNIGDMQILGCKLGMEYLAVCHDDEAVEEWVHTCMGIVKDPELAMILFANVFRGMNTVIGAMTDRPGVREHLQRQAVEAWRMHFSSEGDGRDPVRHHTIERNDK